MTIPPPNPSALRWLVGLYLVLGGATLAVSLLGDGWWLQVLVGVGWLFGAGLHLRQYRAQAPAYRAWVAEAPHLRGGAPRWRRHGERRRATTCCWPGVSTH